MPDQDTAPKTERTAPSKRENSPQRRDILRASAGASLLSIAGLTTSSATAQEETTTETETETATPQVDQPEGVSSEVLASHVTFTDEVGAAFGVSYEDAADESTFIRDPSTIFISKETFEPGGTTGWHRHPGAGIVSVVEGELRFVFREPEGCVSNTYAAGEAFVDTGGHAEFAENTSDTEQAIVYVMLFSVPEGESPTTHVEPQDC